MTMLQRRAGPSWQSGIIERLIEGMRELIYKYTNPSSKPDPKMPDNDLPHNHNLLLPYQIAALMSGLRIKKPLFGAATLPRPALLHGSL